MNLLRLLFVIGAALTLSACDMLGLNSDAKQRALTEADGKAVGSGCRHAGRAIEDCYTLNPTASRAAVFAGWKEMNDYMTKNNIETVKPQVGGLDAMSSPKKASGLPNSTVFEAPVKSTSVENSINAAPPPGTAFVAPAKPTTPVEKTTQTAQPTPKE